jgi:hypothetical protein
VLPANVRPKLRLILASAMLNNHNPGGQLAARICLLRMARQPALALAAATGET